MEKNNSSLVSTCHENPTGQCYLPGRPFPWLPWANEVYSNYWSYYFCSQTKLQKYLYAFLHNTQCFPVPSFWRELKWRHKACHRTAAAGPSLLGVREPDTKCRLWKNRDLSGSPDGGCGLTTHLLYDREVCPAVTPCSKMRRLGCRGLQSTITPKEFLWERMCM